MKLIPNRESEYGKFDLIPDKGQELRWFIDFESELIVVSESPRDISEIPAEHGIKVIPTRTYIVEPNEQQILGFEQWRKYFDYDPVETISADGKLKEIWQRKHEKESNTDFYEGYLIEIETGKKLVDDATSIAFYDKKRTSLIESYYQSIERKKQYLKSLEKGTYPEEKYQSYLKSLEEGDLLMQYLDEQFIYELKRHSGQFQLKKGNTPISRAQWDELKLDTLTGEFETLEDFWKYFYTKQNWFVKYHLRTNHRVIEKSIISAHNQMLQQRELSYDEYEKLYKWMTKCFNKELDRNVYWQFCSNCGERVFYFPRYPKHACKNCVSLITDEHGNKLDYQETHELFSEKVRLKDSQEEVKIFINDDEYWVSDARFGGVVYQKKEKKVNEGLG